MYKRQKEKVSKEVKSSGYFTNVEEIELAIENKNISLHSYIICRFETVDEKGNKILEKHKSTAGRFILSSILPKHHKIKFSLIDRILTKRQVSEVIDVVYRYCGQKETVIFCDKIKALGFKHAFKAAISFGKDDLIIPKTKEKLVNDAKKQIEDYETQYSEGLITRGEKYNKVIDICSRAY